MVGSEKCLCTVHLRMYQDAGKKGKAPPTRGVHADAQYEPSRNHPYYRETEYKQEIDELSATFKGIDLIEVALIWNLAKEYQKILEITPGNLKQFTQAYLRRWDIQNVLTILRGKMQGEKAGKIKEILVPAGSLDRDILDRLLQKTIPTRIIEALKGIPDVSLGILP